MKRVFVAAGGNVDPARRLPQALAGLRAAFGELAVSPCYANAAFGFEGEDFHNLVAAFDTALTLEEVLAQLHAIEEACGRERHAAKWAPRAMDLDVLLFGDLVGEFPGATLPRPDLLKRAYMLGPLADLAPTLLHPTSGAAIAELWVAYDQTGWQPRVVSLA
jgi:2-amino-4-hydroxy-6-hydroxymethyldihydropteridine diphosphokinase